MALGAIAFIVAGCQQEPPVTIERTAEPSESQTPAPKTPQLPTKAEKDDYVGAVAFVEYYYELAEYGERTGEWKYLKQVSAPDCQGCEIFWKPSPNRNLDYNDLGTNPASLNDLIDGIAQVNVVTDDKDRMTSDGEFKLTWVDVVKCTFKDGRWQVISIDSKTS